MITIKLYGNLPYNQNTMPYIDKQFMRILRYINNYKNTIHHTIMRYIVMIEGYLLTREIKEIITNIKMDEFIIYLFKITIVKTYNITK